MRLWSIATLRCRFVKWGLIATFVLVAVLISLFPQYAGLLWHRYLFHHGLQLQVVASGLEVPWALAFLPGNRLLVAERPHRRNGWNAQPTAEWSSSRVVAG
jgi:hypothetical protein